MQKCASRPRWLKSTSPNFGTAVYRTVRTLVWGGAAAQLMGNLLSDCQTKKREGCVYNESLSLVGYVGDGYFINIVHC